MDITGVPSTIEYSLSFSYIDLPTPMFINSNERIYFRAPFLLTVTMDLVTPAGATVTFRIAGDIVKVDTVNADGTVGPTSIEVPSDLGAGNHTLTATVGTKTTAWEFNILKDPRPAIIPAVPDAFPEYVPESLVNGIHRWVLQDLMPGGLGSWVMPANPKSMSPLPRTSNVDVQVTVSTELPSMHVTESEPAPAQWSFAGYCPNQEFYDQLVAYVQLKRRLYLHDHRGRAWTVSFEGVEMVPRKRQLLDDGTFNDWAHDYTVNAVIYDQTPQLVAP